MNKVFIFIFILILNFFSLHANEEIKGKMGYLTDGLNDVKYKDARIAFDLWVNDLAKGDDINVSIQYYDTLDMIRDDYKNFKFDFITINTYFLLENQDVFYDYTKEFWSIQKSDEHNEEYIILVGQDSKIKMLEDLKGQTIALRDDDYVARMVLDKEILAATQHSSKAYLDDMRYVSRFSTAILQTYFGQVDACIIPSSSLKTVVEMNPNILNKVRVIYTSEKIFFPIIGGFHQKANEELLKRFSKEVAILFKTPRGHNILDLFKMKKMILIDKKELNPILEYYKEYMLLKKKYLKEEEKI